MTMISERLRKYGSQRNVFVLTAYCWELLQNRIIVMNVCNATLEVTVRTGVPAASKPSNLASDVQTN